MRVLIVVAVALAGGVIGGVAGWFSAPLLVPEDPWFAGFLVPVVVPCGTTIGLLLGFLVGRGACTWLRNETPSQP